MEPQGYKEKTVVLQDEGLRKLKGFIQIPRFILLHDELSYGAKVAYGILLNYAWQDEFCFPAQKQLATDLRCSDRWVRKFLDELKKAGYIDWKQQGLNRPNIYYLLEVKKEPKNLERNDTSTPERNDTAGQDRNHTSDYIYSKNNKQNNVYVTKEGKGEEPKTAFQASDPPAYRQETPPRPAHGWGREARESKTVLHDLPNLDQPPEQTSYIADDILKTLGDAQSKPFYTLVAAKIPESVIRQKLSEIKQGNAHSPAKVFVSIMKHHAANMLQKQKIQAILLAKQGLFRYETPP